MNEYSRNKSTIDQQHYAHERLPVIPTSHDYHEESPLKRGFESMQTIHGSEVSISYSPSMDSDLCTHHSTLSSQNIASTNDRVNGYSLLEGTTVPTQSVMRSTSSYISNYTSVTTSTKTAIASESADANGANLSDKISTSISSQSPLPQNSNQRQENFNFSMHQSNSPTVSNIEPSPATSPKSPIHHQESNYLDSALTDSSMAPSLQVPKSPRTPNMGHRIRHRFIKKTLYVSLLLNRSFRVIVICLK